MRKELIIMTNKESRRYDIIKDLINKKINGTQASIKLSLSVRQIKRLKARVKKNGIKGVVHRSRGRESNTKTNSELVDEIVKIAEENYSDFTSQLTYEKLTKMHKISLSYSTIRRIRISSGLSTVKARNENKNILPKEKEKSILEK